MSEIIFDTLFPASSWRFFLTSQAFALAVLILWLRHNYKASR